MEMIVQRDQRTDAVVALFIKEMMDKTSKEFWKNKYFHDRGSTHRPTVFPLQGQTLKKKEGGK